MACGPAGRRGEAWLKKMSRRPARTRWPGTTWIGGRCGMLWLEVARSLVMLAFSRCGDPAAAQNAHIRAVPVLTNPEPKAVPNGGSARMLSPLGLPRWVATGDLRRDPGLIVAGLASRPPITVYWDGVPR
jgi:hypothetical protein